MFNLYCSNLQMSRLFRLEDNKDLHGPAVMTALSDSIIQLTRLEELEYVDYIEVWCRINCNKMCHVVLCCYIVICYYLFVDLYRHIIKQVIMI